MSGIQKHGDTRTVRYFGGYFLGIFTIAVDEMRHLRWVDDQMSPRPFRRMPVRCRSPGNLDLPICGLKVLKSKRRWGNATVLGHLLFPDG